MARKIVNSAVSFCTTGNNDHVIARLVEKLQSAPTRHVDITVQGCFESLLYREGVESFGREVRDFVAQCILRLDFSSAEMFDVDDYFSNMIEAVDSLLGKRSEFPVMRGNSEVRRAYLEFVFAMMNEDDHDVPLTDQLFKIVHSVDAPSYKEFRDDDIVRLVLRHPDQWEKITTLITSHKITHVSALEALLEGHVKSSFGSGVL